MSEITPFEIEIAEEVISDLKGRLSRTRWPDKETVDDWTQGVPLAYQKRLMDYWLSEYDFQRLANRLNQYNNFHTRIENLSIHFIHIIFTFSIDVRYFRHHLLCALLFD